MKTKAMQYFSDFTYIIETNTEPTFTCSNSTIETLVYEHYAGWRLGKLQPQGKYQSKFIKRDVTSTFMDVVLYLCY